MLNVMMFYPLQLLIVVIILLKNMTQGTFYNSLFIKSNCRLVQNIKEKYTEFNTYAFEYLFNTNSLKKLSIIVC